MRGAWVGSGIITFFLKVIFLSAVFFGCDEEFDGTISHPAAVEVGIPHPDGATNPDFEQVFFPLAEGDVVPVETFGQGGYHISVGVRCHHLGNAVFIDVEVINPATGASVEVSRTPQPRLIACNDDETLCERLPIFVTLGGLASLDELDGLEVEIRADVESEQGKKASGTAKARLSFERP